MDTEFYETDLSIDDTLFDLFVDQLHRFAEMEEDQTTVWVSSSADRASHF